MAGPEEKTTVAPARVAQRAVKRAPRRRWGWLAEPRNAVLIVLGSVVLIGGGRQLRRALLARRAVGRLEAPGVSADEIREAMEFGRPGLFEFFRLLSEAKTPGIRDAAGQALATLWARDELIGEEEKAIVRRGYRVDWRARRRYPRALRCKIPFTVDFGIPFLREDGDGVRPSQLEWSYRVGGARRASLESFGPWTAGPGRAAFHLFPGDFETNGPHRLVFEAKVRTVGLTDPWELELPHIPFHFELDPQLEVSSILAPLDDARAEAFPRAIRLEVASGDASALWPLGEGMAVQGIPTLVVNGELPSDLAHAVEVEFADAPGWRPSGVVTVTGQGSGLRRLPLEAPHGSAPPIDRRGTHSLRVRLVSDPDRGWAHPDIRSVWPGTIELDGVSVEVVRL
jgi:hypothetical protein